MTILSLDECRKVNEVVDYILTHYSASIGNIKKKFDLTTEEYDMISELMMPAIHYYNRARHLECGIAKLISVYSKQTEGDETNELAEEETYYESEDRRVS